MVAQIEEEIREKKNRYEKQGESVVSVSRVAPPVPRCCPCVLGVQYPAWFRIACWLHWDGMDRLGSRKIDAGNLTIIQRKKLRQFTSAKQLEGRSRSGTD
jgi:hypothetical protein